MKTVEYWLAIEWICEDCGRNNFSSMITPEFQEDKDSLTIEPWEDVKEVLEKALKEPLEEPLEETLGEPMFLCPPEQVVCKHCGLRFEINNNNDQDNYSSS